MNRQLSAALVGLTLLAISLGLQADLVADFAKRPEILQAQISPKGDYIAVLREVEQKRAVFVFNFPEMKNTAVLSYPGRYEVGGFRWVSDDRIIASVTVDWDRFETDFGTGELFGINADGTKSEHLFGYRAGADKGGSGHTKRTANKRASARIAHRLWNNPKEVLVNITYWSAGLSNVVEAARMNVYSGRLSGKVRAPATGAALVADKNGDVRFSFATDDDQNSVIHIRDKKTKKWSLFSSTAYGKAETRPIIVADDDRIYVRHATDGGPTGIYLMDPKTQALEKVFQHELVDAGIAIDRDYKPYGIYIDPGRPEFISLENSHPQARLLRSMQKTFADGAPTITSVTADQQMMIVQVDYDKKTPEYYLYEAANNRLSLLFDSRPWVNDAALAEIKPISFKSRDGLQLHGYLSIPPGAQPKNLPLIVVPHGGPHGVRDYWSYDWFDGIIPMSGYAMLKMNYRGSGGYGNDFEVMGHGQWGKKMQDDVTDATHWAIEQGIADPQRVCIYGWSYGGYATLMGIEREPDLYHCAVAGAGVYDQNVQYRRADFTSQTRWGKKYMDRVIGPTKQDRDNASPTNYVSQIKTPLLLVHGDQDARVPIEHLDALKKAMKKAGKPTPKSLILKKEAHTPRNEKNLEKMWRTILAFFETHIGPGVPIEPAANLGR